MLLPFQRHTMRGGKLPHMPRRLPQPLAVILSVELAAVRLAATRTASAQRAWLPPRVPQDPRTLPNSLGNSVGTCA